MAEHADSGFLGDGPLFSAYDNLKMSPSADVRAAVRAGAYAGHTAGLGADRLQTNIVILPETYASDFLQFCRLNPKPCPLAAVSEPGASAAPVLGHDIDIRTDLPAYNVYRNGRLSEERTDISDLWTDDLVTFALGCSFAFEQAVQNAGVRLWHIENNCTVPMFRSGVKTRAAGPFSGDMVVSMRAIPENQIDKVISISEKYPIAHGGPVHWGDPAEIGIKDIRVPDWGDPAPVDAGFTPMFWACGVTPQVAVQQAKPPVCITHKPGHMLITDLPGDSKFL